MGERSGNPRYLTEHQGNLYFSADDGVSGHELWRSDGTETGTFRVSDINPGPVGSHPIGFTSTSLGLMFAAYRPETGTELWITDGTEAGTRMVADLYPGTRGGLANRLVDQTYLGQPDSSYNFRELYTVPQSHFASLYNSPVEIKDTGDGRAVFRACDPDAGCQLWITNGKEAGTLRMTQMGPTPGGASPGHLTIVDDTLYFAATDALGQREIWIQSLPNNWVCKGAV